MKVSVQSPMPEGEQMKIKTFQELLQIWLETEKKLSVKRKTYLRYSELIKQHILPKFGKYKINQITTDELKNFLKELSESGNKKNQQPLSTSYITSIFSIIKSCLDFAVQQKVLKHNFAKDVPKLKHTERLVDAYSQTEQKKLEEYIEKDKKQNHIGIIICLYTGIRLGELLALTWQDVDFEHNLLSINKTYAVVKDETGHYVDLINAPKTNTSTRIIPIQKFLVRILKNKHKNSSSKFILSTSKGKMISPRSYQRTFTAITKKCGISTKNFHSLRHTFATRALESGMDVKSLSEILGHKNAMITLNRYGHSLFATKQKMMNTLSKLSVFT